MERVVIKINDKKYEVEKITKGKELKKVSNVSDETALFREISHEADIEIISEDLYTLENDMVFYTEHYHEEIKIYIDHKEYSLEESDLSGKQIKELAEIEVGEFKLLKEILHGADLIIEDAVIYHVENRDEFFSVHNNDYENLIKLTILCIDENYKGRFNINETLRQVVNKVVEELELLIDVNEYYLSRVGITQEIDLSLTVGAAGLKNGERLQFVKRISGGGERQ